MNCFNPSSIAPLRARGYICAARRLSRFAALCVLSALTAAFTARTASAQQYAPAGSLLVTVQAASKLTFAFENKAGNGACSITGSGSTSATLNLGTASIADDSETCVTFTRGVNGTSYTLGNTFYVKVTQTGGKSASYTLTAKLAKAAPTGVTWQANDLTLSTVAVPVAATAPFSSNLGVTLGVTVQSTVTTKSLNQTIDLVATAN